MGTIAVALAVLTVSGSALAQTPLLDAVRYEDVKRVQSLLDSGADPSAYDRASGTTPVHLAASIGNVALVKVLLDAGAQIDARDIAHYTPLHQAARSGRSEAVKLLLE